MKLLGYRKCSFCGAEIAIYNKKRMERENTFCSIACQRKFKIRAGLNCQCVICKKPIHVKPYHLNKIKIGVTCSKKCAGELKRIAYKGEKNPNFGNVGEHSPLFKGNVRHHCKYLWEYAPWHPFSVNSANRRVRQHRLVAEKYLLTDENSVEIDGKRYLKPEYDVHHIDGDKYNNNPNNLMVLTRAQHSRLHAVNRISKGANR